MFHGSEHSAARSSASVAAAIALLIGLSGCAPEPSNVDESKGADASSSASADAHGGDTGAGGNSSEADSAGADDDASSDASLENEGGQKAQGSASSDSEGGWPQQGDPQDTPKSRSLPASFPSESFVVPETAAIDDAGERSANEWYLVLDAKNAATADALWQSIVDASGFAEADRSETADGGVAATLTNSALSVTALQIPQEDGSVLVSFDLSSTIG